jgi:hypothetical protein
MKLMSVHTFPMPLSTEELVKFNKPIYSTMVREMADALYAAVSENEDISDVSFCYFYDTIKSVEEPHVILSETLGFADGDSEAEAFDKFRSAWNDIKNVAGFRGGYLSTWRRGYLTVLHFAKE